MVFSVVAIGLFILFCVATDKDIPGRQEIEAFFKDKVPEKLPMDIPPIDIPKPEDLGNFKEKLEGLKEKVKENLEAIEKDSRPKDDK